MAAYTPRWFTCPSINRARRRVTTLIKTNALLLSHATTIRHYVTCVYCSPLAVISQPALQLEDISSDS